MPMIFFFYLCTNFCCIWVNGRDEYGQVCMEKHQQSAKLALFYDLDSLNDCKKYCAGNSNVKFFCSNAIGFVKNKND